MLTLYNRYTALFGHVYDRAAGRGRANKTFVHVCWPKNTHNLSVPRVSLNITIARTVRFPHKYPLKYSSRKFTERNVEKYEHFKPHSHLLLLLLSNSLNFFLNFVLFVWPFRVPVEAHRSFTLCKISSPQPRNKTRLGQPELWFRRDRVARATKSSSLLSMQNPLTLSRRRQRTGFINDVRIEILKSQRLYYSVIAETFLTLEKGLMMLPVICIMPRHCRYRTTESIYVSWTLCVTIN